MSLSPSLSCYNTDQQFRCNNIAFLYFLLQFCVAILFATILPFHISCNNFVFLYFLQQMCRFSCNIVCLCSFMNKIWHFRLILSLTLFIRQGLRGDHWVLYSYIKARKQFQVVSTLFLFTSYAIILFTNFQYFYFCVQPQIFKWSEFIWFDSKF